MLASNVCDQEREFEEKLEVLIQRFGVPAEIDGVRIDPMGVGPYGSGGSKAPAREEGGSGLPFCGYMALFQLGFVMEKWLKAGPGGRYLWTRLPPLMQSCNYNTKKGRFRVCPM